MKKLLRRRPSAAMVLAIVALVAALAGTAVAGGGFLTKKKFNKFKSNAVQRLTYVNKNVDVAPNTNYTVVSVDCPSGLHPVGGGARIDHADDSLWWGDGNLTPTGYAAAIHNGLAGNTTVVVTVACAAGNATGSPSS